MVGARELGCMATALSNSSRVMPAHLHRQPFGNGDIFHQLNDISRIFHFSSRQPVHAECSNWRLEQSLVVKACSRLVVPRAKTSGAEENSTHTAVCTAQSK